MYFLYLLRIQDEERIIVWIIQVLVISLKLGTIDSYKKNPIKQKYLQNRRKKKDVASMKTTVQVLHNTCTDGVEICLCWHRYGQAEKNKQDYLS